MGYTCTPCRAKVGMHFLRLGFQRLTTNVGNKINLLKSPNNVPHLVHILKNILKDFEDIDSDVIDSIVVVYTDALSGEFVQHGSEWEVISGSVDLQTGKMVEGPAPDITRSLALESALRTRPSDVFGWVSDHRCRNVSCLRRNISAQ